MFARPFANARRKTSKVVGVGSVGTRAWLFLLVGREGKDPLVLGLHAYTRACGWSLARAHARSGDRLAIAAYLGEGSTFDRSIARFSAAYADQNELDHQRLAEAVAAGDVPARFGV